REVGMKTTSRGRVRREFYPVYPPPFLRSRTARRAGIGRVWILPTTGITAVPDVPQTQYPITEGDGDGKWKVLRPD
ncbi:MAG: hypothetical protein ACRDTT_34975, partial [Pseudonocardiaceae bacterium]